MIIEHEPDALTNVVYMAGFVALGLFAFYGFQYPFKTQERIDRAFNSPVKERCIGEGGKPIFIGASRTWNCELKGGYEYLPWLRWKSR